MKQEGNEMDKYLDKETPRDNEVLPPDYQKFLDKDEEYQEWLDELENCF